MTAKKRRSPVVPTVRHDRGNGLASVAPLGGRPVRADEPAEPTSEPESFDPSEHNIDDVQAHVADHPDELDAILAAERDGKNRSTLIEWLEGQSEPNDS